MGLAVVATLVLTSPSPALALPKPRKELYWFNWWELEEKVWPISTGKGVTVAVIDGEVNRDLPDLQNAVLPNVNMDEVRVKPKRESGGHGTAMSALIVGQGHGTGMVGVAPGARVLPLTAHGPISWSRGLRYASDHGAKVINMSVGAETFQPCLPEVQEAVSYAVKRDAVVVVSAGNEGRRADWRSEPANCAGVLAVGGLDGYVKPWSGSTPGEYVMAAAPAVEAGSIDGGGRFEWRGHAGTSQAAALTSGVVALIRSKYPKMSAREVVQRILATSKDVGKPGWDDVTGYGLVRPYRALVDKVPANAPNPIYGRLERSPQSGLQSPHSANPSTNLAKRREGKASEKPWIPWNGVLAGLIGGVMVGAFAIGWRLLPRNRRA
ncbi:S8 family serine peptidase [Actinomadura sp. 6N118]|uniref:S8 family serine peptidase n=1 Tax=Actinomadura sp. 6N118 TaxID=3375151 RepID=UPI00378E0C21